jgi:hypothetical protein
MAWNPTNANDVTLIVSVVERDDTGSRTGTTQLANTASLVVDDFSLDTDENLEGLRGVGNRVPQGISRGDLEHQFSFTVQGEDADLLTGLTESSTSDANSTAKELEITAKFEQVNITLTGAYAGTRNVSGSSGDPIELEVEGMATKRSNTLQSA